MALKFYIALAILSLAACGSFAQNERHVRESPLPSDSNIENRTIEEDLSESERTERFYDSLRSKTTRRGFSRMLYRSFFRKTRDTTALGRIYDETEYFGRFEGLTIGNVILDRSDVYDQTDTWIKRLMLNTHVLTRRKVLRRDLLFSPGDTVNAQQLVRNKQIILYRPYIAEVEFELVPNELDSSVVDVVIHTRDKWSIGAKLYFKSRGRSILELYDDNFIGTGNHLGILTSADRKERKYKGNGVQYTIPSLLGSFYRTDIYAGKYYFDDLLQVSLYKNFINPTDYELGASVAHDKLDYYMLYADSMDWVKKTAIDFWAGKSYYIPKINSSVYFTGRYSYADFPLRPDTTSKDINPAFHNHNRMIYGLGLYREKFYAANMINGYGFQEYLASGYRAEIVGGYQWGEFRDAYYIGLGFHTGGLHNIGYIHGGFDIGTFITEKEGKLWQSALDVEVKWFSNLFKMGRSNMRQFITLNHTRGWKRGDGSDEVIKFTRQDGPRTITQWNVGTVRSVLRTETVFFTPFKPIGFRTAIFGWADFAMLGYNNNIFRNSFYNTLGVGVRLKNERLTFSAIEIRFGLALGKGGVLKNQWFHIGTEQRIMRQSDRFLPTVPDIVGYQ
ncbi:MAG: hypothetical protein LUE10_08175 [Alistipes sp.]|nr:hypothetical protein [Alistipes sp.]